MSDRVLVSVAEGIIHAYSSEATNAETPSFGEASTGPTRTTYWSCCSQALVLGSALEARSVAANPSRREVDGESASETPCPARAVQTSGQTAHHPKSAGVLRKVSFRCRSGRRVQGMSATPVLN
jgi:hypothetical protein